MAMDKFTKNFIIVFGIVFVVVTLFVLFGGYAYEAKWVLKSAINNSTPASKNIKIQDVDFRPYMEEVKERIGKNWTPPHTNTPAKIETKFEVNKNGTVKNIEILRSSGNKETDDAVIKTLQRISPLPPLPVGFKQESLNINYTFEIRTIK